MKNNQMSVKKCVLGIAAGIAVFVFVYAIAESLFGKIAGKSTAEVLAGVVQAAALAAVMMLFGRKDILVPSSSDSFAGGLRTGSVFFLISAGALVINTVTGIRDIGTPGVGMYDTVMWALSYLLSAGICEEFLCRGIMMNFIRSTFVKNDRRSLVMSMTLSSAIFGMIHLLNLTKGDVIGTLGQVIYASGIGFYLAAVYARTNNLTFNAFLHFLFDVGMTLYDEIFVGAEESVTGSGKEHGFAFLSAGIFIAGVSLGLFLIRKKKSDICLGYHAEAVTA